MAALPYMQLYVAEYLADTSHLNAAQHGAYLLLLMNYWQRGKPLANSDERLAIVARMTPKEWSHSKATIAEFFIVTDSEWVHERVEKDLEKVTALSATNTANGKRGGRPRKPNASQSETENKPVGYESQSETKGINNRTDTEQNGGDTGIAPEMVAQAILSELKLSGMFLLTALDGVCRAEMNDGRNPDELLAAMVAAWREYDEAKPRLKFPKKPERFFGDGDWRNKAGWPWKDGATTAPSRRVYAVVPQRESA